MYVYIAKFEGVDSRKVGISKRLPRRLSELQKIYGEIQELMVFFGEGYKALESLIHYKYRHLNTPLSQLGGTEFFNVDFNDEDLSELLEICDMRLIQGIELRQIKDKTDQVVRLNKSLAYWDSIKTENNNLFNENKLLTLENENLKILVHILKENQRIAK